MQKNDGPSSRDVEPSHPWEDKAPCRDDGRWKSLLVALCTREVGRVDAQGAKVACLRAAVAFDSSGSGASGAENCECAADETLAVSCGSHLFARFRFLSDEQKMGFAGSFCNAQLDTPAMQRKQARSTVHRPGLLFEPWEAPAEFPKPETI
jgi:hypothetical protein